MKHGGKRPKYKGFGDAPEKSGGAESEKLNEGMAQSTAANKHQSSPPSVMADHKKKTPLDVGGRLAGC